MSRSTAAAAAAKQVVGRAGLQQAWPACGGAARARRAPRHPASPAVIFRRGCGASRPRSHRNHQRSPSFPLRTPWRRIELVADHAQAPDAWQQPQADRPCSCVQHRGNRRPRHRRGRHRRDWRIPPCDVRRLPQALRLAAGPWTAERARGEAGRLLGSSYLVPTPLSEISSRRTAAGYRRRGTGATLAGFSIRSATCRPQKKTRYVVEIAPAAIAASDASNPAAGKPGAVHNEKWLS
jgi:hypothetical protein